MEKQKPTLYAGQLEDRQAAYVEQDYNKAYQIRLSSAEQGHSKAQLENRLICYLGKEVDQDLQQAAERITKAAK